MAGIIRLNQLPEGSGSLTNDDIFLIMDNPNGSAVTKKISLSQLSSAIGGGSTSTVVNLGNASGIINTDASLGSIFDITLIASGTLNNPSNTTDGQSLRWRISFDDNSIPLTLGNKFNIPSSASSPLPFSVVSGVTDLLAATYHAGRDKWDIIAFVPGY